MVTGHGDKLQSDDGQILDTVMIFSNDFSDWIERHGFFHDSYHTNMEIFLLVSSLNFSLNLALFALSSRGTNSL